MFPFVCALRLCEMLLPLHNLLATLGFLFRIYTTYTVYQSVPNSWSQSKSDQIIKFFSFLQCIYTFRYITAITIDCRVTVLCFRLRLSLSVCDCHPPCLLLPAVRTDKMPGEWRDAYLARTGSAQQISSHKTSQMWGQSLKALLFYTFVSHCSAALVLSLSRSEKIMNTCDMTTFRPQQLQWLKMFGQDPKPHWIELSRRGGVIEPNWSEVQSCPVRTSAVD